MPKTITLYTPEELKAAHPKGYRKVCDAWREMIIEADDSGWDEEYAASVIAVLKACECTGIKQHPTGLYFSFDTPFRVDERQWFIDNVLKPNGYKIDVLSGKVKFPGLCPFTGFAQDDDCLEFVWNEMTERGGYKGLHAALMGLGRLVRERSAEDVRLESKSEDSMWANWGDRYFTAEGDPVSVPKGDA